MGRAAICERKRGVYRCPKCWRDFESYPKCLQHLQGVSCAAAAALLVRRQELPRRVAVGQELGPLAAEELHLDLQGPRLGRRLLSFGPRRRRRFG